MTPDAPVTADVEKLRAVLCERGLPVKVDAQLNFPERKLHEVLAAAYDFRTGSVEADIPRNVLARCGTEFAKLWQIKPVTQVAGGKLKARFTLTPLAIKTTLRTALKKDAGIFKAKVNTVILHDSWGKYIKTRVKPTGEAPVDWSKAEAKARRHNAAVVEQINDGKTFNAQKDNPWARKHLKNREGR